MSVYNDEEDEWYCNSIQRYKELVMFETEYVVGQIEFSDPGSICVLGRRPSGHSVLSELALPAKIVNSKKNLISINNDLKIKAGVFPTFPIAQILCIYGEGKIVAAEESLPGVAVYELNVEDSDKIQRSGTLTVPLTEPVLSLIDAKTLLLTANNDKKPVILDLASGKTSTTLEKCSFSPFGHILPTIVSPNVALLCKRKDSHSILYDIRTGSSVGCILGNPTSSLWTAATNYHPLRNPAPSITTLAFLSASGLLRIYDLRNLHKEISNCQLTLPDVKEKDINPRIQLSPSGEYLSVSGYDTTVGIYHLGPSGLVTEVFKHDGHEHMEHCNHTLLSTVTDHVWYDNYTIISAADNMSLNCWQPSNLKLLWNRLN
ncbi:hypothetical protein O3M35_009807 [Rhynocoris fuscipes]|uniref:Uncharacterized protein n=1 Tax=Rhynocoris fuscipes TaxID=488301 RepID=A0AAW1D486_9HEMI